MKRTKKGLIALAAIALLSVGILIRGVGLLQAPPTGTWAPTSGPMSAARAGAASVLLPDGRVLITGGCSAGVPTGVCSAPLASAEFLNADGNFYPAPPMSYARSGHTATLLQDGRVLVAGGADASGSLQTAEIYDPSANTWTAAGSLMAGRSGHTATLLQDGTVLIAGGSANGAALSSLEIFDATANNGTGGFTGAGILSSPRQNHAAALLSDGRVLIVGGWDGTMTSPPSPQSPAPSPLSSSDIYDPAAGTVAPGPAMSTARMNFTATSQLDGKVAAIGGCSAGVLTGGSFSCSSDLASIEVFDPSLGAFQLLNSQLSTARSGHLAFLLPHNANILVVGGVSASSATSADELYTPWNGTVAPTGSMASARAAAVGSPLSGSAGVPPAGFGIDGALLVAGGYSSTPNSPLPGAEVYGYSWIKTDQADYAPGTTVTITGGGWQPNETLAISLVESPYFDTHGPYTVTVGPDGSFSSQTMTSQDASCATDGTPCIFAPDEHDISIKFILTAVGSVSQVQTTFTDASKAKDGDGTMTVSPTSVTAGSTGNTLTFIFTSPSGGDFNSGSQATILVPAGWTAPTSGNVSVAIGPSPNCTAATLGTITGTGPWTIPINMTCPAKDSFTVTFSNVTAPSTAGTYTFTTQTAQSGGTLTPIGSSPVVTVNGAAANKLAFVQQPTTTVGGNAISPAVTVQIEDQYGNPTTSSATVTMSGGGTLSGSSTTSVAAVSGVATFSNLVPTQAGSFTLSAASTGLAGATSNSFTVNGAAAYKLAFVQQPSNTTSGSAINPAVTVQIEDQYGNLTSSTATVTMSGGGSLTGTTSVAAVAGVATFSNLVPTQAGSFTLSAASTGLAGATSSSFTVNAAAANKLAFVQQPTTTTAGNAVSPAVTVQIQDQYGNLTSSTATVTMSGGGTLAGSSTTSVAAVSGVATFSNLVPTQAGSFTLSAASSPLTGATSSSFTVNAATATQLVFGQQPSNATAGSAISPSPTVKIEDQYGNLTTSTSTVAIAISAGGTLTGTTSVAAVSGVATFSNLVPTATGTGFTLAATDGSLTGATSNSFNVTAGAANKLAFVQQPTTTTAGNAISPAVTVQIQDQYGNLTSSTATVTMSGGGTLTGTTSAAAVSGVATFSNLVPTQAGSFTLSAASTGLTGATSSSFTVSAAAANKLAFGTQPSTTTAGSAVSPAPTVKVEDQYGNVVTTDGSTVTIAISTGGAFTGSSTTSVAAVSGVATFSNLVPTNAGTNFTLGATDGSMTCATSSSFTVNAATATQLVYGQQPSNTTAGSAISPSPTVKIEDQYGNVATSNTSTVAIAISAGGTLTGTTSVAAVSGVATFSNLVPTAAGTGFTLKATDGSLTSATSSSFNVTAGAANKLAFVQQPTTTTAGNAISPAVTVQIQDQYGNLTSSTATVTMSGGGTLTGTMSVAAVSGVATFSNLVPTQAGSFTLSAASTGLTGATSSSFTVSAAAANKLAFVQQPSTTTAGSAISPAVTVQILDQYGNLTTSTATVTMSGGGTLTGTASVAAVSGVATFSNLVPTQAGSFTLSAASAGLAGATSSSFTVNVGALAKFVFAPIGTQTAGTPFNVTITAEDAAGNTVTSYSMDGNQVTLTSTGTLSAGGTPPAFTNGVLTTSVTISNTTNMGFTITATGNPGHASGITGTSNSFTVNPVITASAGANGSISPSGAVSVNYGSNQTFSITPSTGYNVASVLVDGSSVGAVTTYTFSDVTAAHTITASFVLSTNTITVTQGTNGTISPGTTAVNYGSNQTFSITPSTGYNVASVLVDGSSVGAVTTYTFSDVTAAHTITASFVLSTNTITVTQGTNGTISPGTTAVNYGSNQTFSITPSTGYNVASVLVDGSSVGAVTTYTFSDVTTAHTITASFVLSTNTITVTQGTNGTISPGTTAVNYGSNQTFSITPSTGYNVASVTVDGSSVGAVTTYTFSNVTTAHTITASFVLSTNTITVTQGTNGTISPGTTAVNYGSNQTFSITPSTGYNVASVLVDGSSVGAVTTYTFSNVTTAHTITASFVLSTNTITVTQGTNGTISPGTTAVNYGSNQTFSITPSTGYNVASVTVDGSSVGAVTTYTFSNVTAAHTITASFVLSTNTITVTQGTNGTISPGTTAVNYGSNQTFSITPSTGYNVASVTVDGSSVGAVTTYTFSNVTTAHTITASFVLSTNTITVTQGTNGTISPGTTAVNYGSNQTFSITPSTGYNVASVTVDGSSVGAVTTYTFSNVTTAHTITASFVLSTNTITVTQGTNGTISPGTTAVNYGSNQTFSITPSTGYNVASVLVDGSSVGAVTTYTFSNVTTAHTITASFVLSTNTITVTQGTNGTISPGTTAVNYGSNQTFSITPSTGYNVASVTVDGSSVGAVTTYTFSNVTTAHTITASFVLSTNTITVTQGTNGTISPGTTAVNYGSNQTFSITPSTGYNVASVLVDGSSVGAVTTYTFSDVTAAHTITASFTINTYTLTYTAGPNGTITGSASQTVNYGSTGMAVSATPSTYYHFVMWSDGSTANPRTDMNVTANISVTASFAVNTYTLTYTAGANGSINGTSPQTVNSGNSGTPVTAVANSGYHFTSWSDGVLTASRTDTSVTANISVTASFAVNTYTLTYTAGANGSINRTSPQTVNSGSNGMQVAAVPSTYYHFVMWSDGSIANPRTDMNVTANISVTASFALNPPPTISWSTPADISYGTALSGTQLNASTNVAGTFIYSPAAGTVLSPGTNQTLSTIFTPTDYVDFSPASASVLINVIAGPVASVSPASLQFLNPIVKTTSAPVTITLSNVGSAGLTISSIALGGTNKGDFAIQSNNCPMSPNSLAASGTCAINVTDTPQATGTRTATLTITDNSNNLTGSTQTVSLSAVALSSITSNFNGTAIAGGRTIWFNAVLKPQGIDHAANPVSIYMSQSSITIPGYGSVPVPNSVITFDPGVTSASISYDSNGRWIVVVPTSGLAGNTFLNAVPYVVPAGGLPGGIKNVTWQGLLTTDTPGVTMNWQWASAVYTSAFATDYNAIGVKPVDDSNALPWKNSDHAGTPENYKQFVTGGAMGGGGSNWTGSYSGTAGISPAVAPLNLDPDSVDFGSVHAGATATACAASSGDPTTTCTVTIMNPGTKILALGTPSITGANAGDFTETNNCGAPLGSAGSCTINLSFTPGTLGTRSATLSITSTPTGGSPTTQTVDLTGNGVM